MKQPVALEMRRSVDCRESGVMWYEVDLWWRSARYYVKFVTTPNGTRSVFDVQREGATRSTRHSAPARKILGAAALAALVQS